MSSGKVFEKIAEMEEFSKRKSLEENILCIKKISEVIFGEFPEEKFLNEALEKMLKKSLWNS